MSQCISGHVGLGQVEDNIPDNQGGARHSRSNCELSQLSQLAELPVDTLKELARICRPLRFQTGQIVAHEGERPDFIGFVHSGILRMQKTLEDGRQHIVGLLVEGDMFGRVFDGPLNVSVESVADAEVCAMQRAPFESLLLRSPELDRVVLLNILDELDRARDWMIILAKPKVKERLAGFLMVLCSRFAGVDHILRAGSGTIDVKIPISRTDLAHLLGSRPESISRAFHALADGGSIALKKPDLIEIRDMDALCVVAGDEDAGNHPTMEHLLEFLHGRDD